MEFRHSEGIWCDFPELAAGVVAAGGISADVAIDARLAPYLDRARARLAGRTESELPEIQAWRRAFSRMELKPTQYRCASEALLRRFRKEDGLPRIHPLIDLCNALSLAYAIPIAVLDTEHVAVGIEVRRARGDERFLTLAGETEHPDAGEVIFADEAGYAHARRWTHRQSGLSAVRDATSSVLIVAEAMHDGAAADIERLVAALGEELAAIWDANPATAMLSPEAPTFTI